MINDALSAGEGEKGCNALWETSFAASEEAKMLIPPLSIRYAGGSPSQGSQSLISGEIERGKKTVRQGKHSC